MSWFKFLKYLQPAFLMILAVYLISNGLILEGGLLALYVLAIISNNRLHKVEVEVSGLKKRVERLEHE